MSSYKELVAQKAKLEQQIEDARKREISEALKRVREIISEFELTPTDVFPAGARAPRKPGAKAAAKYRNPETAETWTGRGRTPNWLKGKKKEAYLIA